MAYINTDKFSSTLRSKGIDLEKKRILITNFKNSKQSSDFSVPMNCNGFGRIHHFVRKKDTDWPENPLPNDPASRFLNLPYQDVLRVQIFQNAICSWRCWYCFVDEDLLMGNKKYSEFKTAKELINLYLSEIDRPNVIDISGGQPDLVPEWSLWLIEELELRGLQDSIYLWSDDNLSNDYLWRYLKNHDISKLAHAKCFARVGCFKGFDSNSFSFNTQAEPKLFETQFHLMKRLVQEGFDVFGYVTLTSLDDSDIENKVIDFIDKLQNEVHPNFPLRTVPLKIYEFTPTLSRIENDHQKALKIQSVAVEIWKKELFKRYTKDTLNKRIFEHDITID